MAEMTDDAMAALSACVRRLRRLSSHEGRGLEVGGAALLRLVLLRQAEAIAAAQGRPTRGGVEALEDRLASELPGLFAGAHDLPPDALAELDHALRAPELASAWDDDTTLGWVYQYWNDPEREAIDERVGPRGKVGAHEIARKTQLFTERYMVDWLLQNSLGRVARTIFEGAAPSWPFFVRGAAPLPRDGLPARVADIKILDPACGAGHFLAGAFDVLVDSYRAEAAQAGVARSDASIAESILEHNLHGADIDPRAVQVAAAVLYLKVKRFAPGARLPPMNIVAAGFDPDPRADEADAATLRQVSVKGSLLRFGARAPANLGLFDDPSPDDRIERLVSRHARPDDLGVRFDAAPLPAGARLRRLLTDGVYDVVALNPPYLATAKIDLPPTALLEAFGDAPDLFAAFVDRAYELCKPTGLVAFVALSNWMFLHTFREARARVLEGHVLLLADVGKGAFRRASKLIQSAMVVASPARLEGPSLAARVGSRDVIAPTQTRDIARALEGGAGFAPFDPSVFSRIEGAPLLFWLDPAFMRRYATLPKIGDVASCAGGIATSDNPRFLRAIWEVPLARARAAISEPCPDHLPYLKGAEGRRWFEPYRWVLRARCACLEVRLVNPNARPERSTALGVAYTTIGHAFAARLHTVASVRDVSGASAFPGPGVTAAGLLAAMNRSSVRELAAALNPTVNFQLNDVRRLPFDAVEGAEVIAETLRDAFEEHERGNELSLDYVAPGQSRWRAAQGWAQAAVDRPRGAPLPEASLAMEPPPPFRFVSHGLGVALGRFSPAGGFAATDEGGLPGGALFLGPGSPDLDHPACAALREAWDRVGAEVGGGEDLATYLRLRFFAEHRRLYEGLPIFLPLSSSKKRFVAYVSLHRLSAGTLSVLLTAHLAPALLRLERELGRLGEGRSRVEGRIAEVEKLAEELRGFVGSLTEVLREGPPTPDARTPAREVDAPYDADLDDGALANAAVLWPLLEPQWKEPRKVWQEIATSQGKRLSDGSRVARRYFPGRVLARCRDDASLAAAHGLLWELHPGEAYAWELRLEDEIRPGSTLDEPGRDAAQARFFAERPAEARGIVERERKRRARRESERPDDPSRG